MSKKNEATKSTGIGLGDLVFLIFLVLKLTGIGIVAHWSWWAVTAPLWVIPAVLLAFAAICALVIGVISLIETVAK